MGSTRLVSMEACNTAAPAEKGMEEVISPSNSSEKVPPPVPSPCQKMTKARDSSAYVRASTWRAIVVAETLLQINAHAAIWPYSIQAGAHRR